MGTQNDAEDIMEHALREAEQRPAMTTREEFDTLLGGYCRKCETRHDCPDPCELMLKALTYADKREAEVARLTERVRELERAARPARERKTDEQKLADGDILDDGCGSTWSAWCPECGKKAMQIVRPGKVQCAECG